MELDSEQLAGLVKDVQNAHGKLSTAQAAKRSTAVALSKANGEMNTVLAAARLAHAASVKPKHDADTAAQSAVDKAQAGLLAAKTALDAYIQNPTPAPASPAPVAAPAALAPPAASEPAAPERPAAATEPALAPVVPAPAAK